MQANPSLLVLKSGGAALAQSEGLASAAELIAQRIAAGHRVCVVVSAAGDTTDYFARQADRCGIGVTDREADALMACGENITAALMAMHLRQRGHEARSLSGAQAGFVTDAQHGDAAVLALEPHRVRRLLNEGTVPVVAGFQGATVDGDVTTLGRGGSDLTAVLLGAALGAGAVELYKDVAGVYDRAPTEHAGASLHAELDHDQLLAIVQRGGHAVVQAKAIVAARAQHVTLRIVPFAGDGGGVADTRVDSLAQKWSAQLSARVQGRQSALNPFAGLGRPDEWWTPPTDWLVAQQAVAPGKRVVTVSTIAGRRAQVVDVVAGRTTFVVVPQ